MREKCPNTKFFLVRIFPHSESLRIQSDCGKIRTKKISVFGHFSRSEDKVFYPGILSQPIHFYQIFYSVYKLSISQYLYSQYFILYPVHKLPQNQPLPL